MVHTVKYGKTERQSYSRIQEILEMPNLIAIQKDSYRHFLEVGLKEIFKDFSPITDYTGNLVLEFVDYKLDEKPKYTIEENKERDSTYSAPLNVRVRVINKETGVIKEDTLFFGDFPLMTDSGTFIMNGAERVIVSQLVRSPGAYYEKTFDKAKGKTTTATTLIPNRGAWLEYEIDYNECIHARVDRNRKVPATMLFRAFGYGTNDDILNLFSVNVSELAPKYAENFEELLIIDERLTNTLMKDTLNSTEEALLEIYKKIRPGEPAIVENARSWLTGMFFEDKRYDLSKVGRYKFNKKLSLYARIAGRELCANVVDPSTGEIIAEAGETLTRELAEKIQDAGVNTVYINTPTVPCKIIGNNTVKLDGYVPFDPLEAGIKERVYLPVLQEILEACGDDEEQLKKEIIARAADLVPRHLTLDDVVASFSYLLNLDREVGNVDDIDHLGNRRIRCVGELLQNQFRIGLSRMDKTVREKMNTLDRDIVTPQAIVNTRAVSSAIREFFGSSQLSQFMDQTNPLAELANKRRLSALGPGGLNRDRATF
ncbi:MAG: DNA-directed RNA polymerase subunit beta, partial [Clostridia bacterium]|nr:DNA-directed RNA polymerase subunit beta [Clostridia bacterium]